MCAVYNWRGSLHMWVFKWCCKFGWVVCKVRQRNETNYHGKAFRITGLFVREIHRPPVVLLTNGPVMRSCEVFFLVSLNKLLNKQSNCRILQTSRGPCNTNVIIAQDWGGGKWGVGVNDIKPKLIWAGQRPSVVNTLLCLKTICSVASSVPWNNQHIEAETIWPPFFI